MKFLKGLLMLAVCAVLLTGCLSKEELTYWLENGVVYEQQVLCVTKSSNRVQVKFRSPSSELLYNRRIQKPSWLLFSKDYDKLSDLKEDIMDAIDEDVSLSFIFYRAGSRENPIETVSLDYNPLNGRFLKQAGIEGREDPWLFVIDYNLSNADIDKGTEIRGCVRLRSPKLDGAVFSKEIVIKTFPDKKGFFVDLPNCAYVKANEPKNDPVQPPPINPPLEIKPIPEPTRLLTFGAGYQIAPGFVIAATPQKIRFAGGEGWLYLLNVTDVSLQRVFNFPECEFTIADAYDQKTRFYQQTWSPFITQLFANLDNNTRESKGNFFTILLQGSADGGSSCPQKSSGRLSEVERLVHGRSIPYLFKEEYGSVVRVGDAWQARSPVINNDLPYLRSAFIKSAMENSIVSGLSAIGVANGQIVRGYSPNDRKVSIYLVQTDFDLSKSYPQVFRQLIK